MTGKIYDYINNSIGGGGWKSQEWISTLQSTYTLPNGQVHNGDPSWNNLATFGINKIAIMNKKNKLILNCLSLIPLVHQILMGLFIFITRLNFGYFPVFDSRPRPLELKYYFIKQIDIVVLPFMLLSLPIFIVYVLYCKFIYKKEFQLPLFCTINFVLTIFLYYIFNVSIIYTALWYYD